MEMEGDHKYEVGINAVGLETEIYQRWRNCFMALIESVDINEVGISAVGLDFGKMRI